jgi:hypothetical protein
MKEFIITMNPFLDFDFNQDEKIPRAPRGFNKPCRHIKNENKGAFGQSKGQKALKKIQDIY